MEAALINWQTDVDDHLGGPSLCRSMTSMSPMYEACSENVMSLLANNDRNGDRGMDDVHGKLLSLLGSVNAVRARAQFPSLTDPPESD